MRFNKVGYLGEKTTSFDELNQQIESIKWHKTYYNPYKEYSIEYAENGENKLKKYCEFQIRSVDYNGEQYFKNNSGEEYSVTNPLEQGEYTVIQCEKRQANR